jgi:hypothetical protein
MYFHLRPWIAADNNCEKYSLLFIGNPKESTASTALIFAKFTMRYTSYGHPFTEIFLPKFEKYVNVGEI